MSTGIEPRRIVTADEQDVHTRWRKLYCYTLRAGVAASVKRETNRRERRERKLDAQRRVWLGE